MSTICCSMFDIIVAGSRIVLAGGKSATQVRNFWRYNPASRYVPPTSCFFDLKGTEPKNKSSKRENGQKNSAYGHALRLGLGSNRRIAE